MVMVGVVDVWVVVKVAVVRGLGVVVLWRKWLVVL